VTPVRARNADGGLSEAAFQAQVVGLARFHGWRVYHAPDNRPAGKTGRPQRTVSPDARGFPDLICVRGPRIVAAELKAERGRVAPEQSAWLQALEQAPGVETYIWRPRDWDSVAAVPARGGRCRASRPPSASCSRRSLARCSSSSA
jgi:hypothetical protein